ncbi:dehydrogenase [Amycolatopsis sp. AA4]|uniref:SDR family NAD(P)-dependent oxidoreductase n=1 Tax=Actinomycetes TaxID=1760 RepID=UPI0001B55FA6|nr:MULTISPECIES: SDR family oxidoreductase [Actinomycetes]ATY10163.1 dehydrogenase [Amycolatopsis sp. AA4]EFL05612.1 2-hydroxycyclohexanecarboxyl-CoA dehydrogenase [Streptomyces sp. AA4]
MTGDIAAAQTIGSATAATDEVPAAKTIDSATTATDDIPAAKTIGSVTAVAGDIADPADLDRLYDAVRARGKGLDIVFANAAAGSFASLEETTAEHFDQVFGTNVRGTLFTVQKALPLLNKGASVILTSSVRADDGLEAFGTYSASKAAIRSYARTWANELKGRGIRVNVISPGTIDTPVLEKAVGADKVDEARASFAARVPLGRMGTPREVADAVVFLASEQSSFILGANIYVDGGEKQF